MAMDNSPCIDDVPSHKPPFISIFSRDLPARLLDMFDYRRIIQCLAAISGTIPKLEVAYVFGLCAPKIWLEKWYSSFTQWVLKISHFFNVPHQTSWVTHGQTTLTKASINRIYGFYDECKRRYSIRSRPNWTASSWVQNVSYVILGSL